jgi:hypothetical protein
MHTSASYPSYNHYCNTSKSPCTVSYPAPAKATPCIGMLSADPCPTTLT